MQQAQAENKSAENLIGQFGVGFYSVFMVAERVELTTRSWQVDSKAWEWKSFQGGGQYEIAEAKYDKRGTRVTIFLKKRRKGFFAVNGNLNLLLRNIQIICLSLSS